MTKFIDLVLKDLIESRVDLSEVRFIFPSRRAKVFLKRSLSNYLDRPIFSPIAQSIDEFVEDLSGLRKISSEELFIEFYKVYKQSTPKDQIENFDSITGWAKMLINDFNEIDRYLVDPEKIFQYLKDIKETEHWAYAGGQTEQIKSYLRFWSLLPIYYDKLNQYLKQKGLGYSGSIYKEAIDNLEYYITSGQAAKKHVFVGFNALNKAEERIIQDLLEKRLAEVYWDIDDSFISNPIHDVGLFIRNYLKTWNYYQQHTFKWKNHYYKTDKTITVSGVPKNIGQIKYVGDLITGLLNNGQPLEETAIVLADENLLLPLLNSLPQHIGPINITMGLPLQTLPIADLFELLFIVQKQHNGSVYHRFVKQLLKHPLIQTLFPLKTINEGIDTLNKSNKAYLSLEGIKDIFGPQNHVLDLLFTRYNDGLANCIDKFQELIYLIREKFQADQSFDPITLECLYKFHTLFNKIQTLLVSTEDINDFSAILSLYKELVTTETLDLRGEPLSGLQIMGMLETRVLDFENVIVVSVNEEVLPAGKTDNSFIPFDVKLNLGLPTYKEKDAVYAYHFYHLLFRSKNVELIYNTDVDSLIGGEKSRFISQLEFEGIHQINHRLITLDTPAYNNNLKEIEKTDAVWESIKEMAEIGFSPSSLTTYIRNPLDFYQQRLLKVKEFEDVEETIAFNTMGTIIHAALEELYKPFLGNFLTVEGIQSLLPTISDTVNQQFQKHYNTSTALFGKNLIIQEICKRYIEVFLKKEMEDLSKGNSILLKGLEQRMETSIKIDSLDFPVKLKGNVDRMDIYNGQWRIIDYKTGKVLQNQLHLKNWEDLTTDYDKYSKSFQILCYSLMVHNNMGVEEMEAGIISFKNLKGDYFLKFGEDIDKNKEYTISAKTLDNFSQQLKFLITEILDKNIPFKEKELKQRY